MKSLKKQLKDYLLAYGRDESLVEIYNSFPFAGDDLTNRQKGDRVRSVWRKMQRQHDILTQVGKLTFTKNETSSVHMSNQPKEDGNYLILGCVHAPFVNKPFWNALCNYAEQNKDLIKGVILNGDFLDLNSLSSHDRGRTPLPGINIGQEYKDSKKLLDQLTSKLNNNSYKAFLYGNHEDRFKRYMSYPDAQKLSGGVLSPEKGLALSHEWNVFTDWKHDEIQLGDLSIIHGEFFNIHLCKKYLDVFKKNMLFAHCFSSDTEVLTRQGWVNFQDVNQDHEFATLDLEDRNKLVWQKMTEYHKQKYTGDLIHFKGHGMDLKVTPNHKLLQLNTNKDKLKRVDASKLQKMVWWETLNGASNQQEDFEISDDLIKLLAWVITDGTFDKGKYIKIKQCDKGKVGVKRITDILDRLNQEYSISYSKSTNYDCGSIYLKESELTAHIRDIIPNKAITTWMYELSKRQFDIFLHELILGDGNYNKNSLNSMQFGNKKKEIINNLQALCIMNGYRTNCIDRYKGEKKHHLYCLTINTRLNSTIHNANDVAYDDYVYCVSVPNKTLLVRRNGVTSVSGNSHRQQLYREGRHAAYNIGCMLDINSPVFGYASKAMKKSWANGFALGTLKKGKTTIQLVTWDENHFTIGNNEYR